MVSFTHYEPGGFPLVERVAGEWLQARGLAAQQLGFRLRGRYLQRAFRRGIL